MNGDGKAFRISEVPIFLMGGQQGHYVARRQEKEVLNVC